jgi:hypothetical protein
MKKIIMSMVSIICCAIIFMGCTKESSLSPNIYENMLKNSSFELNGTCSYGYWNPNFELDSELRILPFEFSSDIPAGGGTCSIVMFPNWGPPITLSQTVPAIIGSNSYSLSFWAKKNGVGGKTMLYLKHQDSLIFENSMDVKDTVWKNYQIFDNITAEAGDSIMISLSGGFSQLLTGKTYFDLIDLHKVLIEK